MYLKFSETMLFGALVMGKTEDGLKFITVSGIVN
jgi:hypothetical protein